MAHIAGWITPEQARGLQEDVQNLNIENYYLQTQIASLHTLEQAVDSFNASRSSASSGARSPGSDGASIHLFPQGDRFDELAPRGESSSSDPTDQLGQGAGTPNEQSDDQGVDNLRSDEPGPSSFTISP